MTHAAADGSLNASSANTFEEQLAAERRLQQGLADSADFVEGVRALLEKRAPRCCGQ